MSKDVAALQAEISQLKFLLASAPMIDAPLPTDPSFRQIFQKSRSPFAYIHPKTMSGLTWGLPPKRVYIFPGSPTKWLLTSLMPEGRVIYSPFPIPGYEKVVVG